MRTPFRPVPTSSTQSSSTTSSSTLSSSPRSSPMQISSRPSAQQFRQSSQSSEHHHHQHQHQHRSSLHSSHSNNSHLSSSTMPVRRHIPDNHTFSSSYSAAVPMQNLACSPTASRTSPMAVPTSSSPTIHSHSQSFVPPHLLASMSKKPESMARSYNKRRPPSWL